MSEYYDRQGQPMAEMMEWGRLHSDMSYKRVAETTLPDGTWISTVWLGIDHRFGSGPPLIFESMAFSSKEKMEELDCERYSTEAEAIAGHAAMVEKFSKPEAER